MFLNIDYAKRAAARDHQAAAVQTAAAASIDDDDIDYEQLFEEEELPSIISKPVKRVRFAATIEENSPTPVLSRPPSARPTFDLEFDFDSLASPVHCEEPPLKSNEPSQWKDAFLSDLHTAKKNPSTSVSSPSPSSIGPIETQMPEDTLWDFMKESNPELLEKLERANQEKQKRSDRFGTQQSSSAHKSSGKVLKVISTPDAPGIHKSIGDFSRIANTHPPAEPPKSISVSDVVFKQPEPANISIVEILLEKDEFNRVHEELLTFLIPYHKILCRENIWPQELNFTSPNASLQLIKTICDSEQCAEFTSTRSDVLKYLMFIYTITSFLCVFAYCSLQTAIRHVENVIVQNMRNVCIDQECGKPLFDLLTKTHQKFENVLHPKISHIKKMFLDFFERRRQMIMNMRPVPEPKFLLLVQYESIDLLHDIERGLSSILELRSCVFDKAKSINRDELNDLFVCNNMIIIRTRQISPTVIHRPKRLTLVIEYEYGEQMQQWYRFCHQHTLAYLAYRTILPSFTASENEPMEITAASLISKQEPSILNSSENKPLPTIILARPLVDNFKLLRTLESREDLSIITRDYHLLAIPTDQQPDILIDWTTSMIIFDLNIRLDINLVQQKIQSMTLHSSQIHVAILTSGSTPDFILSTYITPITQLAKQIQEKNTEIQIQIKSFGSLEEFANHVAHLAQQDKSVHYSWIPTSSWNEKMLLRRCSSLNSISAQLILQRLTNTDLSTVTIDMLIKRCPEIPLVYLKTFLSDMHRTT